MENNELSIVNRSRNFFITNFWILSIILIGSVSTFIVVEIERGKDLSSIKKELEKINAGVVIFGINGEAYYAKKSYIDNRDPLFKLYLKNFTRDYFIEDVSSLTQNRKKVPENIDQFYEQTENFKTIGNYFMDLKNDKENLNDMMQHLKILLNLINTDNLVEDISILTSKIEKYTPVGKDGFEIKVSHKAKVDYYLQEEGAWKERTGNIVITIKGRIQKNFQTPINAMGIKIDDFETNYLTKRGV